MRKMILTVVALFVSAGLAYAHPASKIDANIDKEYVAVVVYHNVSNPAVHYIDNIKVKHNGTEIINQKFTSQTDKLTQKMSFDVPGLKKGDTLEINTNCNMSGKLGTTITVK